MSGRLALLTVPSAPRTSSGEVVKAADDWDTSVGKAIATRTREQNREAAQVAKDAESRAEKIGGEDSDIVHAAKAIQLQIDQDVSEANTIGLYLQRYGLQRQKRSEEAREQARWAACESTCPTCANVDRVVGYLEFDGFSRI